MDFKQYRELLEAYAKVHEQNVGIPLNGRSAEDVLQKMIPKGEKVYTPQKSTKKLQNAHYELDGDIIDEVKGFGGHVDPETGKSTGKRSPSQKAHTKHWDNRRSGKNDPDERRSKFKYGGSTKSTTGAQEGDTPEGFAKKQNPDLAMTPNKRMQTRANALEKRGQGKRANKIRSVMNRPNMSSEN